MKIDNRKRWLTVLDTETTGKTPDGGLKFPLIYDIGWVIGDTAGNVAFKREFIVQEVFYNPIMANAFYGRKMPYYQDRVCKADILVKPFREIMATLNADLALFKKNYLMAYNLNFDLRALKATAKFCGMMAWDEKDHNKLFDNPPELQDIWGLAVETIALPQKEAFYDFIEVYNLYTPAGNPKTSAEVLYRYIKKDPDFIESHTALADCEIEYEIAVEALSTKKKFFKGILPNPWQKVKFPKAE